MTYPQNPYPPIVEDGQPVAFSAPPPVAPPIEPVYKQNLPTRPTALFKLDDIEREAASEKEDLPPFTVEGTDGEVYTLIDPQDADWQDILVAQENPRLLVHVLMPEEQREKFLAQKMSLRVLTKILSKWQSYYSLTTPGEAGGSAR